MTAPLSHAEFREHQAAGYNRIPVARTILADTDTPLSAYAKLAQGPRSFLFESVEGGERWGRYSIIALQPDLAWRHQDGNTTLCYDPVSGNPTLVDCPIALEGTDHTAPLASFQDREVFY